MSPLRCHKNKSKSEKEQEKGTECKDIQPHLCRNCRTLRFMAGISFLRVHIKAEIYAGLKFPKRTFKDCQNAKCRRQRDAVITIISKLIATVK